ncbi:CynX/NimT family MFS transporter [Methylobacillus arboreus]|uniref:CynX/NimT family MFS transporter n=1 Tax=Methylobacillus arboreus TaxID=755170 RepID=UPI001E5ADA81|nr:CynX/NimT family MFS transporter [Methylobacillus arboreus]MCB5189952.1 CynX/NimT family MFS transporter [Methylobacillus arboreus]
MTQARSASANSQTQTILLVIAIILIGINLRPAFSSVSPLLAEIRSSLGLSAAAAGMLTTLPVACLGLFAPFAPWLARHYGAERSIIPLLLLLAAGIALRGIWSTTDLFIGTGIAGICIGLLGILLPGIIKREFPKHPDLMTGVYTMALCLGTALAAGLAVPLFEISQSLPLALAAWALPVLLAALFWWPFRKLGDISAITHGANSLQLLRDSLAWQVTLFMGLQSALAYCVFGWLPSILQDRGITAVQSGIFLSGSIMVQVVSALLIPWLSSFMRDQKLINGLMLVLIYIGLMGAIYASPDQMWIWMMVLGFGQGGGFAMALAMIVLRTRNPLQAAQLSAMSQGLGYTLASLGPFLMGVIHEASGDWQSIGWLLTAITVAGIYHGSKAGAKRYVLE